MIDDPQQKIAELEQQVALLTAEVKAARAELDSFSYSISHDLRAPLRAIEGFSSILLEDHAPKLEEEPKRLLDTVRRNSKHMSSLLDALLNFSRVGRQPLSSEAVDLSRLARSVVDELRSQSPDRAMDIQIHSTPQIMGDTLLLRQMLRILFSNAIKFTGPKSPTRIEFGAQTASQETVYFLRDNGVGFDMQYATKLFGLFQRMHSIKEFDGTGVGLSVAQRILQRHGGRIWAEAKPDEGACFYFVFGPAHRL